VIGRALDAMPEGALQRVVTAPVEAWTRQSWITQEGRSCLHGHLAGAHHEHGDAEVLARLEELYQGVRLRARSVELRFDDLGLRYGLPRVVPLIQARARQALARKAVAV
jgi:hypothetical protein